MARYKPISHIELGTALGGDLRGDSYQCNCPAHNDDKKSLSVTRGEHTELILECFADCTFEEVLAAARLKHPELAEILEYKTQWITYLHEEGSFVLPLSLGAPAPAGIDSVYEYHDQDGELVKYKVKFSNKDFAQYFPLPSRRHKICGAKNGRAPELPYKLPELIQWAKAGRVIYITEGEKDCENFTEVIGLPCTTLGGVGNKWRDHYREYFAGAKGVVILPDNDLGKKKNTGIEYGNHLAANLTEIGIPVKMIPMPGKNKDFSDWWKAGGTKEQFLEILRNAKPWESIPMPEPERCFEMPDLADTDTGSAEIFCQHHEGKIKFVPESSKYEWMYFNGRHWAPDAAKMHERLAKKTAVELWKLTSLMKSEYREDFSKWAKRSRNGDRQSALLRVVRSDERIIDDWNKFDSDPYLLAVGNGLLDLKSKILMPFSPMYRISCGTEVNYNPDVDQSKWLAFLDSSLKGNKDVIAFLKRSAGYTLSGITKSEVFWYVYGPPRRGKGTFLECLYLALGSLAAKSNKEVWLKNTKIDPTVALGTYTRSRFIWVSEVGQDDQMDASRLKDFIGGDPIRARKMYTDGSDFKPKAKLWIAGNHLMRMDSGDDVFGKMMPVVFDADLQKDEDLKTELIQNHLEAVLAWAVEGWGEYQKIGLKPPKEIITFREEYQKYMDILGNFMDEACNLGPNFEIQASKLYAEYRKWCEVTGLRPWTQQRFGRELQLRKVEKKRMMDGFYYIGITLKSTNEF